MPMKQTPFIWIITVLSLMLVVGWVGTRVIPAPQAGRGAAAQTLIGGPFELTNGEGKTITEKDFAGKYMLIFFGFTHCPDFCPTTLLTVQNALTALGSRGDQVVPVFITVDPERDTPKVMGDYVKHFGTRMVGLSGTPEQIRHVADVYKVYYSKIENPEEPQDYMMDHSGFLYLMDDKGHYVAHYAATTPEAQLKDALAKNLP